MKKFVSLATVSIAAATLAACGSPSADGDYTGTVSNEGITVQMDMSINGDVCQFSMTAPIIGEMPMSCQIDQSTNTITLDGDSIGYSINGKNFVFESFEGEEEVVLEKIG